MNQERWINDSHGLELYIDQTTGERGNENGILFLAEFFFMKDILGTLTQEDIDLFSHICEKLQSYKPDGTQLRGIFDRGAGESLQFAYQNRSDELRTISHDNLTAISAFSQKYDLRYARDIAKYGLKHLMIYNNRYPGTYKLCNIQYHPRDWFFWMWNAGFKMLALPWFPIFFLANVITCFTPKDETSGKMLMFTRTQSNSPLFWITKKVCYGIMRLRYGKDWLHKISKIYFHQPDHPIPILAEKIHL